MKSPFDILVIDKDSAIQYLIALALSPYRYHIDDDPDNVLWGVDVTGDQILWLKRNTRQACEILDMHTGVINDGAWDIYGAAKDVVDNC